MELAAAMETLAMETIEFRIVDKTGWGDGPWQAEPDKRQWQDKATGLPCLIVRNPIGALCGYVGVPAGHPVHGKGYDDVDVGVHGGLTFADRCHEGAEEHSICHKPAPGESDDVWWLGFDCAHAGDLSPQHAATMREIRVMPEFRRLPSPYMRDDTYKDIAYVEGEVQRLAAQLAALADAPAGSDSRPT